MPDRSAAWPPALLAFPGDGLATLFWKAGPAVGLPRTGFDVLRGPCAGCETLVASLDAAATSWHDTGVQNGETYHYVVAARNAAGPGLRSNPVVATPSGHAPALPDPTVVDAVLGLAQSALEESMVGLVELVQDHAASAAAGEFANPAFVAGRADSLMDGPVDSPCFDLGAADAGLLHTTGFRASVACFEAAFGCRTSPNVYLVAVLSGIAVGPPDCKHEVAASCPASCLAPERDWNGTETTLAHLHDVLRLVNLQLAPSGTGSGWVTTIDGAVVPPGPKSCDPAVVYSNTIDHRGTNTVQIIGTALNDKIYGNSVNNLIDGRGGDDCIMGGDGHDHLIGGDGHDLLFGEYGEDRLEGGNGDDLMFGEHHHDHLYGGEGADRLYGDEGASASGNDHLDGGNNPAKEDYIYGGPGNDVIHGGEGWDYLRGGSGLDYIYGGATGDYIDAESNSDFVDGGFGADRIYGGSQDDTIHGGPGVDSVWGDSGRDTVYGHSATSSLYDEWDWLNGGTDRDHLYGQEGSDHIDGWSGDDYARGGAGHDHIYGDAGSDELYGECGDDYLNGGNYDSDWLIGGQWNLDCGIDTAIGGIGHGTFWHNHCQFVEHRTQCDAHGTGA